MFFFAIYAYEVAIKLMYSYNICIFHEIKKEWIILKSVSEVCDSRSANYWHRTNNAMIVHN